MEQRQTQAERREALEIERCNREVAAASRCYREFFERLAPATDRL